MRPDARPYRDAGWQLVPLHRWDDRAPDGRELGKAPAHADWTRREYLDAEIDSAVESGRNVGARPHALQVVVDYDPRNDSTGAGLARLRELLGFAFTSAPTVRTGSGGFHKYFRLPGGEKLKNAIDELPGVEMKGRGRQVLVAGSRHPNGNFYEWAAFSAELCDAQPLPEALLALYRRSAGTVHSGNATAELSADQLRTALAKLDPLDYQDHEKWLALGMACWAAVAGDHEGRDAFVEFSTSDPKYADHGPAIEMRWETWAPKEGEAAITARSLFAQLPNIDGMYGHILTENPLPAMAPEAPRVDLVGPDGGAAGMGHPFLDEIEARHCIVENLGGKSVVVEELLRPSTGTHEMTFSTFRAFKERYAHKLVPKGDDKFVDAGSEWIRRTAKRYRQLEFAPKDLGPDVLNVWRGFAVEPREDGDCGLYFEHLRHKVCGDNTEHFEWLKGWMAHAVQRPWEAPQIAVVFKGGMGTGKGIVFQYFGRLFGRHTLQVTNPEHVVGRFNRHLMDKVFIFSDETFHAGNKTHEQILKGLVTEESLFVEAKGIDGFMARRYFRLGLASNEEWCVPAASDDRRFFVLDLGPKVMGDAEAKAYFDPLCDQMNRPENLGNLLWQLQQVDLSKWDPRRRPKTAALADQQIQSLDPAASFLHGILCSGELPNDFESVPRNEWAEGATWRGTGAFVDALEAQARGRFATRRAVEMALSSAFKRFLPAAQKGKVGKGDDRRNGWVLPSLGDCRAAFENAVGQKLGWDGATVEAPEVSSAKPTRPAGGEW